MQHLKALLENAELIAKYGIGNAHLIWAMALYLDESDFDKLATDGLTDGGGDKKIDFIIRSNSTLYIVQGYYSDGNNFKIAAPSNKASDLNTAMAWVIVGDENKVPDKLRSKIKEVRLLIENSEIESIELIYTHNCAESENVRKELETCANYLSHAYKDKEFDVIYKELGCNSLEKLYVALSQQIVVKDDIEFKGDLFYNVEGDGWKSYVGFVSGDWLYKLYKDYGDDLFSANYRGFMGISKRKKINNAIRQTVENSPTDFFVYNNGISILTTSISEDKHTIRGISIINGAQTSGSIASAQLSDGIEKVKVLCKVIVCDNAEKVKKIVKYNNTQNYITTWDHYSNSSEQKILQSEFLQLGYQYSLKRGFENSNAIFGIETVAQPLVSLHGDYANANRGKNNVFETKIVYDSAFHEAKAQHLLLAFCISKSIEKVKRELKLKQQLTDTESNQLSVLHNLKSKHFLISVIGKIMDELVGKPVDSRLVKFNYNTSLAKNNTIENLIDLWCPVIKAILPIIVNSIDGDFTSFLNSESPLENISAKAKSTIASLRALQPIEALNNLANKIE